MAPPALFWPMKEVQLSTVNEKSPVITVGGAAEVAGKLVVIVPPPSLVTPGPALVAPGPALVVPGPVVVLEFEDSAAAFRPVRTGSYNEDVLNLGKRKVNIVDEPCMTILG
mmetsp:Transcript_35102/g.63258  ORF Transcript_35102/g.63258 Transcript_35102/m.63258 type:complete len:111 (+) Transcript_35102:226-558(+)